MSDGRLLIGNKRYSSWSMRGWLAVHLAGLDVEEVLIPFVRGEGIGSTPAIQAATPAGLVPYLEHKGARIWESLAICEYCAEQAPGLWPEERIARARARSMAAEMHGGLRGLRQAMWFNAGRDFSGLGRTPEALADIARVERAWAEALDAGGGPFLGGARFTLVDAMYAPVVGRFLTWRPELSATTQGYMQAVRQHPLVERWYAEALAEPEAWQLAGYETPPAA
ncbi:glutathione S-transferase [Roseicella sp. DB1501]|uniref:glutathione S-transferase N-terminal domain-containing protein n=1 Tax=Roseicella sp. DB1501 TaxID=2730925 RepID=UPI0014924FDA|nr:glutathione S-transferase [Roseicella sp. DB1501]NOG72569.1 glutathione S-transferase [Roseicella sp. DB1501]